MTHVSVHDGFENVEVVQSRPMCTKVCHSTECGSGGCPGENTTCYSTNEDTCGSQTETGFESGWSCCDGMPKGISMNLQNVDKWVVLDSDADFLNRACAAYGVESKQCGDFAGKKGQITGVDATAGSYTVWVPSAVEQQHNYDVNVSTFTLPAATLQHSSGAARKFVRLEGNSRTIFTEDGFMIDPHNSLVYGSTAASEAEGLSRGWFVNMIAYTLKGNFRWSDYSLFDENSIKGIAYPVVDLLITDEHIPAPECLNDFNFRDARNATCADYTQNSYCDTNGEATQAWCDAYYTGNSDCNFFGGGKDPVTALFPPNQCCTCGGGNITAPVEALPPPGMVFNM